jgi:hypothetical protein
MEVRGAGVAVGPSVREAGARRAAGRVGRAGRRQLAAQSEPEAPQAVQAPLGVRVAREQEGRQEEEVSAGWQGEVAVAAQQVSGERAALRARQEWAV